MASLCVMTIVALLSAFVANAAIPLSTQVHIAFIPPYQMSISWVTNEAYTDTPIVYLSSNNPNAHNITINSTQITAETQSNKVLSRYYHHAVTPPLYPLTQYWYQPGPNASIYTFVSRDFHQKEPFKFLAFGDMGITNSNYTISLISNLTNTEPIDFILHFGDIAYADDRDYFSSNPEYAQVYDEWGNAMEPIFSNVPYMTAPGNHEQTCHSWSDWRCHSELENFTVYRQYFRMPSAEKNEIGGGSVFFSTSSEVDSTSGILETTSCGKK